MILIEPKNSLELSVKRCSQEVHAQSLVSAVSSRLWMTIGQVPWIFRSSRRVAKNLVSISPILTSRSCSTPSTRTEMEQLTMTNSWESLRAQWTRREFPLSREPTRNWTEMAVGRSTTMTSKILTMPADTQPCLKAVKQRDRSSMSSLPPLRWPSVVSPTALWPRKNSWSTTHQFRPASTTRNTSSRWSTLHGTSAEMLHNTRHMPRVLPLMRLGPPKDLGLRQPRVQPLVEVHPTLVSPEITLERPRCQVEFKALITPSRLQHSTTKEENSHRGRV